MLVWSSCLRAASSRMYCVYLRNRKIVSCCRTVSLVARHLLFFAAKGPGYGETVWKTVDFEPAWERAVASGLPAILDIVMDPEALAVSHLSQPPWLVSSLA
eukprot:COSAG01_NODE_4059_length_5388_cov_99.849121_4_plen_101_part_00